MPSIEKEPIYDVYCISRRQYQHFLNILFLDVSVAQFVASIAVVVQGGVVMVVGSNLSRGKIFTASIGSVDSLYPSVYIYIYLSYDVASGSEITPCNKICKPLVFYRFTGNVITSITTLRT